MSSQDLRYFTERCVRCSRMNQIEAGKVCTDCLENARIEAEIAKKRKERGKGEFMHPDLRYKGYDAPIAPPQPILKREEDWRVGDIREDSRGRIWVRAK